MFRRTSRLSPSTSTVFPTLHHESPTEQNGCHPLEEMAKLNQLAEQLVESINDNNINRVKELIQNRALVNLTINGRSPLLYAVTANRPEIAAFLISQGARVHLATKAGIITPLMLAAIGKPEIIELLLTTQIPTLLQDMNGQVAQAEQPKTSHDEYKKQVSTVIETILPTKQLTETKNSIASIPVQTRARY